MGIQITIKAEHPTLPTGEYAFVLEHLMLAIQTVFATEVDPSTDETYLPRDRKPWFIILESNFIDIVSGASASEPDIEVIDSLPTQKELMSMLRSNAETAVILHDILQGHPIRLAQ